MEIEVTPKKWYVVSGAAGATVSKPDGTVIATVPTGGQAAFMATTSSVVTSDDLVEVVESVFKVAPALGGSGGSGGVSITFDTVPTAGSTNAVTSGGIYTALLHKGNGGGSLQIGEKSVAWHSATAVGAGAQAMQFYGTAVGSGARANAFKMATAVGSGASAAGSGGTAIGHQAKSNAQAASAYGFNTKAEDNGVTVISAWDGEGDPANTQTLLYLIGAGSTLATTYEDGEACMGYVVKDTSGNVSACGTQKLSALFPNNTAWATMALGLDDETPTPFLPTGATDPIEFPEIEDLTEE